MLKKLRIIRVLLLALILAGPAVCLYSQGHIDNATRAVFIFDIARYIDYGPGFADSSVFRIGVLDRDEFLFLELGNIRKTRPEIQGKPVVLVKFNSESQITYTQLLYVNKASGFSLDKVKSVIAGHQTLLLTEGYEFRESMINFMGVEGEMPKYSVNEDLINKAGMNVNSNMLTQAIKTREDWEKLFGKASREIIIQRDTIRQQLQTIQAQKTEILHQKALLDSLDKEIVDREKTLDEKQKILESQFKKIDKQQGEISLQKNTIIEQQKAVKIQQDTLTNQKKKINQQVTKIDQQLEKINDQESRIKLQLATLEKQKLILYFVVLALFLVSILGYYIYRGYKIKQEANIRLEDKNRTISLQ
ncbi:MAG TPA: YfiR/HmsC family protein, partial [Bacteroidales bacterium]|nr:YfiR/HmsC family protein [Bacteroidales bacterium]